METYRFDVVVIGAGIAGTSAAAALAADRRVAMLEAEAIAGYHSTGRSAAMWILNYGPPDARVLTRLSRAFLLNPPAGFTEQPLVSPRAILFVARLGQEQELARMVAEGEGIREASLAEARAKPGPAGPCLRSPAV
jgi:D-arginine dehydrogenase